MLGQSAALPQSPPSPEQARAAYQAAHKAFERASADPKAASELGRAAFDLAPLVVPPDDRSEIVKTGMEACRRAIRANPDNAPAHYYLALLLGETARAKKLAALKILREMEVELLTAAQLEPALDFAGPDRSLGMLYLEAPAFPMGVGSKNKARSHLEAAVATRPDYPENRICLAEAYAKWGEIRNLEAQLNCLADLRPKAKATFAGETWVADWKDWESRLANLQKAAAHLAANPRAMPGERGTRRR